jgi:hypothetical protein
VGCLFDADDVVDYVFVDVVCLCETVLDIKAQFMYIPGCMFLSFDDPLTRTAEVKIIRVSSPWTTRMILTSAVRVNGSSKERNIHPGMYMNWRTAEVKIIRVVQGLDLSRLAETHNIYKNVVHDVKGEEHTSRDVHELGFDVQDVGGHHHVLFEAVGWEKHQAHRPHCSHTRPSTVHHAAVPRSNEIRRPNPLRFCFFRSLGFAGGGPVAPGTPIRPRSMDALIKATLQPYSPVNSTSCSCAAL